MIGTRIFSGTPFEEAAGYARAVIDGEMIYLSGTTGFDPATMTFPDGAEAQCEQCFANLAAALAEAGAGLENMLRVRIYVASVGEFEQIKPIIKRNCEAARPANTTIICALAGPEMRVEVEVTAKRSGTGGQIR